MVPVPRGNPNSRKICQISRQCDNMHTRAAPAKLDRDRRSGVEVKR